jgi:hypothetical protein
LHKSKVSDDGVDDGFIVENFVDHVCSLALNPFDDDTANSTGIPTKSATTSTATAEIATRPAVATTSKNSSTSIATATSTASITSLTVTTSA